MFFTLDVRNSYTSQRKRKIFRPLDYVGSKSKWCKLVNIFIYSYNTEKSAILYRETVAQNYI